MQRNLTQLADRKFDLCVIGGGIYGACLAWDAALRGLSVALIEKGDFASATSANSLKTVHGGFRYLQQADFKRIRESAQERRNLMRIAPHLVHPLPVLVPTYENWMQSKPLLSIALAVNDLVSFDRNREGDPQKHIPGGMIISKKEVLQSLSGIEERKLTGGMIFYDGQVHSTERLVLSFLRSASDAGAQVANYVEAVGFCRRGDQVVGVEAKDCIAGDRFPVQARAVINAGGPWINGIMDLMDGTQHAPPLPFAKAINVVTRPLFQKYAVGVRGKIEYRDANSVIKKGNRLFFISPWRGRSLVGTTYLPYQNSPDDFKVTEGEVTELVAEVNQALPSARLTMDDVCFVHGGMVPSANGYRSDEGVQRAKHYKIIDHGSEGFKGLISVMGVKYTTARDVAEKSINRLFEIRGQTPPECKTAFTPVHGGGIQNFETFLSDAIRKDHCGVPETAIRRLVFNYGSEYHRVLGHLDQAPGGENGNSKDLDVMLAETRHGVREEMAQSLADIIFRRTELGSAGHPGKEELQACAEAMGSEFGWSDERKIQEVRRVENRCLPTGAGA